MGEVERLAQCVLAQGQFSKRQLLPVWCLEVGPWHDPGWCPLEHGQLIDLAHDAWHDLDGAGTGTDYPDTLAFQVVAVVPLGAMDFFAFEVFDACNIRKARVR